MIASLRLRMTDPKLHQVATEIALVALFLFLNDAVRIVPFLHDVKFAL